MATLLPTSTRVTPLGAVSAVVDGSPHQVPVNSALSRDFPRQPARMARNLSNPMSDLAS